ncbi:hypothetical protein HK098_002064 [Nowakowskiella sp. JEL0407]|nr:hypothetical protein HK098_002064 [Nowakowskiella sp. JEL0407]
MYTGRMDFEFDVTRSDVAAWGCKPSPAELWNEIKNMNGLSLDFSRCYDLKAFDDRIDKLCPISLATEDLKIMPRRAIISDLIKNPRNCIGMGKTTVASRYVYDLDTSGTMPYSYVLWISLFSDDTFEEDIKRTSKLLKITEDDIFERLKDAVFRWLDENRCYLIIFDNADAAATNRKNLGELRISGHAIITSRDRNIDKSIANIINNERLLRQEITTWSKDVTLTYVSSRLCAQSFDTESAAKDSEIWDHSPPIETSQFRQTLDATFKITIGHQISKVASKVCLNWERSAVSPTRTFPFNQAGYDAIKLNESLDILFSISLVNLDLESSTLSIHLAVQDFIRRKLQYDQFGTMLFTETAASAMLKIFPTCKNDSYILEDMNLGRSLLLHAAILCN